MTVRLQVRAKPGSSRAAVTVTTDDGGHEVLVVRVRARAVDGAANQAVVAAVARALGLRRSVVTLVRGTKSRQKWMDVDMSATAVATAVAALPRDTP